MNLLIMIPIYLFILIGALRLCYVRTLHETKLASIFIQETQGYYLVENLMTLARDYAYQIVQNPREPHLFLSASAYRTKDKTGLENDEDHKDKWVIDFNGSLSKQQIVPDDFSLKIADNGWDIKGGPIFWKDNKKNEKDERYLAEVFMVGSLKFVSNLVPNWTIRTVQTMEIERNPLCDFQVYAEGDITLNTNITDDTYPIEINGPIQINGNARFSTTNGEANNHIQFLNKFNASGYALKLLGGENSLNNYVLPKKYHIVDNCWNNQTASGKGSDSYFFNQYAINYNDFNSNKISVAHNDFDPNKEYKSKLYDSYERYIFKTYRGNFNTHSRVYRPMGFDPSNYWGFWEPSESQPYVSGSVDQNEHVLNFCFGFHNLAQSSSNSSHGLYSNTGENNYSPQYAMENLRGLNSYQMTEKARLVEMQKPINFPAIMLRIFLNPGLNNKNNSSFYVPNNFIFSTYINNAFPAIKDNIYLNRYFSLAFQNNSIIGTVDFKLNTIKGTECYSFDYKDSPDGDITNDNMYIDIRNNKSAFHKVNAEQDINITSIASCAELKSTFSPTSSADDNCPPNKLIDAGSFWTLDNYITRITGDHYNFLYDRNRAKWIQLVDIDVGKLSKVIDENSVPNILIVNTWWQSYDAYLANKNYLYNGKDIRYNYSANREDFFSKYSNGSYVYPNDAPPVIDIGVRLINATKLPKKGLTIYCPYPLYIKGDFNTNNTKPALIVTDSITVLPDGWQDWRSQTDPINSHLWYGKNQTQTSEIGYGEHRRIEGTTIYADIITGRTHPHFWIKNADITNFSTQNQPPNPDLGIHDAFRSLSDLNSSIKLHGSLMLPYYCQEQWEPPIDFCKTITNRNPNIYAYPNIDFSPRANVGIPNAMPFYYRINRGRKTHYIGKKAYEVLSGENLYNKDWFSTSFSFSDYHAALPNYLKYEVAP